MTRGATQGLIGPSCETLPKVEIFQVPNAQNAPKKQNASIATIRVCTLTLHGKFHNAIGVNAPLQ